MNFNPEDKRDKEYIEQIKSMARQYTTWRELHKDTELLINFNFPEKIWLAGTLKQGIDHGYVRVDYNAKRMFKELGWLDERPEAPTVMMTRMAMAFVEKGEL